MPPAFRTVLVLMAKIPCKIHSRYFGVAGSPHHHAITLPHHPAFKAAGFACPTLPGGACERYPSSTTSIAFLSATDQRSEELTTHQRIMPKSSRFGSQPVGNTLPVYPDVVK